MVNADNTVGLLFGIVVEVNKAKCQVKAKIEQCDSIVTHWLHVPQPNTHKNHYYILPDLGSHGAIMMAANGVDGVWLGSIYSNRDVPPKTDDNIDYVQFSDGTTVSYDYSASKLEINCVGDVTIIAKNTEVKSPNVKIQAEKTEITGQLKVSGATELNAGLTVNGGSGGVVNGSLNVNGDIKATGTVMDTQGNSNNHSHS